MWMDGCSGKALYLTGNITKGERKQGGLYEQVGGPTEKSDLLEGGWAQVTLSSGYWVFVFIPFNVFCGYFN